MKFMESKANPFASTFYFFAGTQGNTKKIKRACKLTHRDIANLTRHHFGQTEARTDNKGLKEMAGEVVNQTFVLSAYICGRLTVRASKPPLL